MAQKSGQPGSWLRELARVRTSQWDRGHSLRAALAVGLPWAVLLSTGSAIDAMWLAFGALRAALTETAGDYRSRFRSAILGSLIGAAGFLASHLGTMPWVVTVAVMTAVGFLAAVMSSYSSLLSAGATQALLVASLSVGMPDSASGWEPVLLYLSGVTLYGVLLAIEMLLRRGIWRDHAARDLMVALADLAERRAEATKSDRSEQPDVEEARRRVTACFTALGTQALHEAAQHFGRGDDAARLAALLSQCDSTLASITATDDRETLQAAATTLRAAATGMVAPPVPRQATLGSALGGLPECLDAESMQPSGALRAMVSSHHGKAELPFHAVIDQLVPSRAVMMSAVAVALCLGLAYASRWLESGEHWFWIPLTVGLVMKPDLGSIFARAILRVVGTVIGAAIGAAILLLVPKGVWLALPLALFAGFVPLAAQRSFGWLAVAITPVILIVVSSADPAPVDTSYVVQRIIDTAIGGTIALIFGYAIWPKTHYRRFSEDFHHAKQRVTRYILAVAAREGGAANGRLPAARRDAYRHLMDMRRHLRTALADLPPASREPAAWFPLLAAVGRICDHVTAYTATAELRVSQGDARALEQLAAFVGATPEQRRHRTTHYYSGSGTALAELVREIERELENMDRLREDGAFEAMKRAAHPETKGY